MFTVVYSPAAERDLGKLTDKEVVTQILADIEKLESDPRPPQSKSLVGGKKAKGKNRERRLRSGDYRVIYKVDDEAESVEIGRIRHRRDVYRNRKKG